MGYWIGFKGEPTYAIFIILTVTIVLRTTSSENVTSGWDVGLFTSNGGTTNSSIDDMKLIDGRKIGETCSTNVECQINDRNSDCSFVIDKFICQCAENYQLRGHSHRYRYCILDSRKIGATCNTTEQCKRNDWYTYCIFVTNKCICQYGEIYEEIPFKRPYDNNSYCIRTRDVKLGQSCNLTDRCIDPYAECNSSMVCVCRKGYQLITRNNVSSCSYKTGPQRLNKKQEIYKAAMVALACFVLAILGIFLLFLWNRAIQNRRLSQNGRLDNSHDDIFSICDQLAIERLKDKPPTYEDVARSDQQILGMPPPIYSTNEDESPSTSTNRIERFPSTSIATNATGHHNQAFVSDA